MRLCGLCLVLSKSHLVLVEGWLLALVFVACIQAPAVAEDAYHCGAIPKFIRSIGLSQPIAIDTTIVTMPGLVIRELSGLKRTYQQPSWAKTGHIGPTVRDAEGSIYIIPIPSLALDTNPLAKRNTVYKISSVDGALETFIELPLPSQSTHKNPFGVIGITLDCGTNHLYVSSVAGSTSQRVNGSIYQIDMQTKKVVDVFKGVDALSLAVRNTSASKRLYYGDARSSNVFSIPLQQNGAFVSGAKPRYEISLLAVRNGDSTQARKIRFVSSPSRAERMVIDDTEFSFRMSTEAARRYKKYFFKLNPSNMSWVFEGVQSK